jgi:pyroglutamyl-peptidase
MKVLVTGFGSFAQVKENPSEGVARALAAEPGVSSEVLPVAYARAEQRLDELLGELRPSAVLIFGVHSRPGFRLERVGLNLDDEPSPDVDGTVRRGGSIRPGGPSAYGSSLPLREMGEALDSLGLDWEWSKHAGGFLCNHAFYVARHLCERADVAIPCGLVHVPPLEQLVLPSQVIAARACLDALRAGLERECVSPDPGAPSG